MIALSDLVVYAAIAFFKRFKVFFSDISVTVWTCETSIAFTADKESADVGTITILHCLLVLVLLSHFSKSLFETGIVKRKH